MPEPLTPIEAVIGGVVIYVASDPRVQTMATENDREHFIEGCRAPWFEHLVGQGLLAVRGAVTDA